MSGYEWTYLDYLILRRNCLEPIAILLKIFPDCTESELRMKLHRIGVSDERVLSHQTKQMPCDYRAKDRQYQYHAESGLIEFVEHEKCRKGTYNDGRCVAEKEGNKK